MKNFMAELVIIIGCYGTFVKSLQLFHSILESILGTAGIFLICNLILYFYSNGTKEE